MGHLSKREISRRRGRSLISMMLVLALWKGTRTEAFLVLARDSQLRRPLVRHDHLPLPLGLSSSEDEEIIRLVRGPLGSQRTRRQPKTFFILSDTTGTTAKAAIERSLNQFNGCDNRYLIVKQPTASADDSDDDEECLNVVTRLYPNIRSEVEIARIIHLAQDASGFVVFTLADPELREKADRMCELSRLSYVDLLGPMLDAMSDFFGKSPRGSTAPSLRPGTRRALSDTYYRRIEAVEYTLKCDDGMSPDKLKDADVILLGVSRSGKTPLSVYLSQTFALKVANIPLVVGLPPPRQLFEKRFVNPRRVFCLTLDPAELMHIRRARLERELKHAPRRQSQQRSEYADRSYLIKDLENAQRLAVEHNYMEIDVTGRAVEETASIITAKLMERFPTLGIGG
jgi:[pyruvate, phosphate dikinase]-phosphate phosphotransferase / [pyruvate, phosphate dikinase] kinase